MVSNIDFISAKKGARQSESNIKEASWVPSQAWFESLRYYPSPDEALINDESIHTYSGNTHATANSVSIETNVRTRLGIAPADPDWTPSQLQKVWAPNFGQHLNPYPFLPPRARGSLNAWPQEQNREA